MSDIKSVTNLLLNEIPDLCLKTDEPLSRHTSFRIGGPAAAAVFPGSVTELRQVIRILKQTDVHTVLLGGGTNVLAPDEGIDGVVIITKDKLRGITCMGGKEIYAEAGVPLATLARFACDLSLTGLEFAHGIPGTVGGGLYMNAGAYGGELSQVSVETHCILKDGTEAVFSGDDQQFSYRSSVYQKLDAIIVSGRFRLTNGNQEEIAERMQELAVKRKEKQPLEYPSAGSAFKRPAGYYAGALIEQAGLKGFSVGGAAVSEKHAGFVINKGGATAEDVKKLIEAVRQRVFDMSGVMLEPEIRMI